MTRGRKPDTDEQQAAKGNPGKRMSQQDVEKAKTKQAAPVTIGKVRPPKWLKRSRKATEVWNELAPQLERLNLLSNLDANPFARYCRYVVEWISADVAVQKEGTWFNGKDTNGNDTKKRHPAFQAVQDLEKMLREMESTFGMRPDTRFKIMRDQAAAHGLGNLPLWGDQQPQPQQQSAGQEQIPSTHAEPEDLVGILAGMNSAPPGRMN
ncbi:phage terminase small subunit P27 family [Rhizobium binae]|uniref:phage terminase small subunit P27 family n=1 Tax=Rhizobium binae TaxID=1138190 RepID=UPI001C82F81B|nr:phage terminase small subunit P27 family [Rhizobium binae]MBX4944627.1 phage terminase small subunit P27 family [Rhizobium binae]MBX4980658.1 phage terminase small subunit P27 family [Rhizobium binae]